MRYVAVAAYFVREHGQGRHGRPHLLCPLCWLEKIDPAPSCDTSHQRPCLRRRNETRRDASLCRIAEVH
jgi:hypothetical protein